MPKPTRTLEKIKELKRTAQTRTRGDYDKVDKREETLSDSPGVLALMRGQQRRLDEKLAVDSVAVEPALAVDLSASTFDRHDFGVSDFGVRAVLAAGLIEALGLRAGDKVEVREGEYEGRVLSIESVDTVLAELRFADDAAKASESSISMIARLSSKV